MRDELVRDLFQYLGQQGGFEVGHAPKSIENRLEELPLALNVKRLLQWRWPRQPVSFGPYQLHTAEEILENDDLQRLMDGNMVPVGHALNGDIAVIHYPEDDRAEFGLVCHDSLWEETESVDAAYVLVTTTFEEFLYRIAEGRYLPIDSYAAGELASLKDDLRADESGD